MRETLCRFVAAALLACALPAGATTLTFGWTAVTDWPPGTTVELTANGASAAGITGPRATLEVPVNRGGLLDARARAVAADGQVSEWATLSATLPMDLGGMQATVLPAPATVAPAVIDTGIGRDNAGSGANAIPVSVQSGDLIVVISQAYETNFAAYLPTDTRGNPYTRLAGVTAGTWQNALYTAVATSAGPTTVTHAITATGNSLATAVVVVRGGTTGATGTTANAASSTTWTVDLASTTTADALVIAGLGSSHQGTVTSVTNWTVARNTGSTDPSLVLIYRAVTAAGNYDPACTVETAVGYSGVAVAINAR